MAEYLIQGDTLTVMANHARRMKNSSNEMNAAEILEVMSRTQGNVKTTGKYSVEAISHTSETLKSGMYDTGEVFALPKPSQDNLLRFSKFVANVPITDSYIVVGESPINIGEIMEPIDNNIIIIFNITEDNTTVSPYIQYYMKGTIDWGDGTVETYDTTSRIAHTYVNDGLYIARFSIENKNDITLYNNLASREDNVTIDDITRQAIQAVYVPSWCTMINKAFNGLINLEHVIFADGACLYKSDYGVENTFFRCQSLQYVVLPPSMTTLAKCMFGDVAYNHAGFCGVSSVILPYGVTHISEYCFSRCLNMSNILLPDTVTTIGNYAFYDCYNLSNVYIPDNVTTIGDGAFALSNDLDENGTELTLILPSVTSIGNKVFLNRGIGNSYAGHMRRLTLILKSDVVCSLGSNNFFAGTLSACLNIYVPDSLVDSYKTAENWNNVADYIHPLSECPIEY